MCRSSRTFCTAIAAAGAIVAVRATDSAFVEREFDQFVRKFGKQYADGEREAHFAAFKANMDIIRAENAKERSFRLGLNEHSDLTLSQFATTHLGYDASQRKPRGSMERLGMLQSIQEEPPAAVDWRKSGAVGPIENQGHCGACWAFSATGAISGALQIRTGRYVELSTQQLLDCSTNAHNDGCIGGTMDAAFEYAMRHPLCSRNSYPYEAFQDQCRGGCKVALPMGVVRGFVDVPMGNERALKAAVSQQPVAVGIEARGSLLQLYESGVFAGGCGTKPNHGVLIVGYGSENGADYWLVKNSWGPTWGEDGFFKLRRSGSGPGQCGIMTMPSYPVVEPPAQQAAKEAESSSGGTKTFYGKPPCAPEELKARLRGGGALCAAPCGDGVGCPPAPADVRAQPACAVSVHGQKRCALLCSTSAGCPSGQVCARVTHATSICASPPGTLLSQAAPEAQLAQNTSEVPAAPELLFP